MPSKLANIGRTNLGQVAGEIRRAVTDIGERKATAAKDRFTMAVNIERLGIAKQTEEREATVFDNEQKDRMEKEKQLNKLVDFDAFFKLAGVQDETYDGLMKYSLSSGYHTSQNGRNIGKMRDLMQLYKDRTTMKDFLIADSETQAQGFGRQMATKVEEIAILTEKKVGLHSRTDAGAIRKIDEKLAVLNRELDSLTILESNTRQAATTQVNKLEDQRIAEEKAQQLAKKAGGGEAGRDEKQLRSDIKRLSAIGQAIHKIQTAGDFLDAMASGSSAFGDIIGDLFNNPEAQKSKEDAIRIFQAEYDTLLKGLPEGERDRFRRETELGPGAVQVGWKKGSNQTVPAYRLPDGSYRFGPPVEK